MLPNPNLCPVLIKAFVIVLSESIEPQVSDHLKIMVPGSDVFLGGVPVKWIKKAVVLDGENARTLHVNVVEVTFRAKGSGRIIVESMGCNSGDVPCKMV